MILSIFVYKSRFSCPFFYIKPSSVDVFINKNRLQCIFVYFCPLIQLEKAPNINKKQSKQVFLFIFMWLRACQETREGDRRLKMSERGLLLCWNKYDFGSRASWLLGSALAPGESRSRATGSARPFLNLINADVIANSWFFVFAMTRPVRHARLLALGGFYSFLIVCIVCFSSLLWPQSS